MAYHASEQIHNMSDDLIAKAQSGDCEAFGIIFENHHRFIYKFIRAMLGNAETAEELTQETFLGAYKNIGSLRNEALLKTWLCSIAKNTVYNSFRSKNRQVKKADEEIDTLILTDYKNPPPDEQFLNKELNQAIQKALSELSEDKRLIFILKEMQQLSYNEISEITGATIPKLKTDLFRAKSEMRRLLEPYLEAKNGL